MIGASRPVGLLIVTVMLTLGTPEPASAAVGASRPVPHREPVCLGVTKHATRS